MTTFKELKTSYPLVKTPKGLIRHLENKEKSGYFIDRKKFQSFSIIHEENDVIVVSTGRGDAGGHYYINKNNMNQAIWD